MLILLISAIFTALRYGIHKSSTSLQKCIPAKQPISNCIDLYNNTRSHGSGFGKNFLPNNIFTSSKDVGKHLISDRILYDKKYN